MMRYGMMIAVKHPLTLMLLNQLLPPTISIYTNPPENRHDMG